jgi:putative autotransporter adhesin-like protein
MKRISITLVLLLLGAAFSGCTGPGNIVRGSGKVITESREVSGFDEVLLSGSGSLNIEQTGTESLTIEGEDNIIELIETEVTGGKLTMGVRNGAGISPTRPLQFNLTVKDIKAVTLSGSGDVMSPKLEADDLALEISGSGEMSLDQIAVESLEALISGSGELTVAGTASRQDVRISGSGNYRGADLKSEEARVRVGGSGSAEVDASDTLNAEISGSGDIIYIGDPNVTQNVNGSGKVRKR